MSTAVTLAPASGERSGLAAGRGAEIGDALSRNVAEEAGRQRRRGVLDPPCAFGIAGQVGDPAGRHQPDAAGRQDDAAEPFGPGLRIVLDGEVEARFDEMGLGDAARRLLAVGLDPARPQPVRRIEARRVGGGEDRRRVRGRVVAGRRWPAP